MKDQKLPACVGTHFQSAAFLLVLCWVCSRCKQCKWPQNDLDVGQRERVREREGVRESEGDGEREGGGEEGWRGD